MINDSTPSHHTRFYDVSSAYQKAVLPQCHSPVLRGDPTQARMRAQREQNTADNKAANALQQLDLDPKVDFCSTRLSPRSHRFAPKVFSEGQRTHRFPKPEASSPPPPLVEEQPTGTVAVRGPKKLVPDFKRTTSRSRQRMTWQVTLPPPTPPPSRSVTAPPPIASATTMSSPGQDDNGEDEWGDVYTPPLLRGDNNRARVGGVTTPEVAKVKPKVRTKRLRGTDLNKALGREVIPTFMRLRQPKPLPQNSVYDVKPDLTQKRAASPFLASRPFNTLPPGQMSGRPPLTKTGAAMGSAVRKGRCDVDRITRSWVRRHKTRLLALEADQTAEGSPPPFSIRELLGDTVALTKERTTTDLKIQKGGLDLFLGSGRGDDVHALVGNPSRGSVAKARRDIMC
eukprot:Hpha_TRINITY_DN16559_c2_g5::TRINITY_DN16559_c2_g5_i1::g.134368::m.134368